MNRKERAFIDLVWKYYEESGRHDLPWRQTSDPYHIMVSELMLQQTQVERVIPKYEAFIQRWPTAHDLAQSKLAEVLSEWQGLGYNRRAKFLRECALVVVEQHAGQFPRTERELRELPGIGPYTAGAIMAFAYNEPVVFIDTNVRRVYLHHFFAHKEGVADAELVSIIERTVPAQQAREWYSALMDYGTYLKRTVGNPNRRSKHYIKQSKFEGSDRQIRGAILKELKKRSFTLPMLTKSLSEFDGARLQEQVQKLLNEGLISKKGRSYHLG